MTDTRKLETQGFNDKEPPVDIDSALNNPAFLQFLARNPDAGSFDVNDPETVRNRFEVFTSKKNVAEKFRALAKEQINKDLGLELGDTELKLVDAEIERIAIEDPDRILELNNQLIRFEEFPKRISELENKLSEMAGSDKLKEELDKLEQQKVDLEGAKDSLDILGRLKLYKDSAELVAKGLWLTPKLILEDFFPSLEGRLADEKETEEVSRLAGSVMRRVDSLDNVKRRFGKIGKRSADKLIEQTSAQIDQTKEQLKKLGLAESTLERARSAFDQIRQDLIGNIVGVRGLKEAIQTSVKEKFRTLTPKDNPSREKLAKAKELFTTSEERTTKSKLGINPLGGLDKEKFVEFINTDMQVAIGIELNEVLGKSRGKYSLGRLEQSLIDILGMQEVGFKVDGEARETLASILKENADGIRQSEDQESQMKALLLDRIAWKIRSGKYQTS